MPLPRVPLMQGSSQKCRAAPGHLEGAPRAAVAGAPGGPGQRRSAGGQRVQRLGMTNDVDILHKVPSKRFTGVFRKQYTIFLPPAVLY